MEIRKQLLGPEHPDMMASMWNLADIWLSLVRIHAACSVMKECLELRTKVLGPDHPDTVSSSQTVSPWKAVERDNWRFGQIWLIFVAVISLVALATLVLQRLW